jgi:hypothetical protein
MATASALFWTTATGLAIARPLRARVAKYEKRILNDEVEFVVLGTAGRERSLKPVGKCLV